jgi:hypothetical protein
MAAIAPNVRDFVNVLRFTISSWRLASGGRVDEAGLTVSLPSPNFGDNPEDRFDPARFALDVQAGSCRSSSGL